MKTLRQVVRPKVFEPPVASPTRPAWPAVDVRPGRRPAAAARDDLAPVLRGPDRESRELFGSASDPP